MKFTIRYEYDRGCGGDTPCWAVTTVRGRTLCKCGKSYAQAKERLIAELALLAADVLEVPPPEEVEV